MENTVEILEIGRPNPNPRNIQGKCLLNGYRVSFNIQEYPNGHLKVNWVNFPEYTKWSKIIPTCKSEGGHKYYAGLEIIKAIRKLQNV